MAPPVYINPVIRFYIVQKEKFAIISPTLFCNNACVFCSSDYRSASKKSHAPLDRLLVQTDALVEESHPGRIIISGGEPTLYPDIFKYIAHLRKKLLRVTLFTNGRTLKDKSLLVRFMEAGVSQFHIPMHSAYPAIHDKIARADGAHQETVTALTNISEARKSNPDIALTVVSVVHSANISKVMEASQFLSGFKPNHILLANCIVETQAPPSHRDHLVHLDQIRSEIPKTVLWGKERGQKIYAENIPPCALPGAEKACLDYFKVRDIEVSGFLLESSSSEARLTKYQQLSKSGHKSHTAKCQKCTFRNICNGVFTTYLERFGDAGIEPVSYASIKHRLGQRK